MDFLTALLQTYDRADQMDWVDNPAKSGKTVLLPRYHTSLRSNGKNIIAVGLRADGSFYQAQLLENDEVIIFPVTADSVARAGKNPPPHPLVDKLPYFMAAVNQSQYDAYHGQLATWLETCQDLEVKAYLQLVQAFLLTSDFLDKMLTSLCGGSYQLEGLKLSYQSLDGKEKSLDLSTCYLEFRVQDFRGYELVSVTNYRELHRAYITYVEQEATEKALCNISGQAEVITAKHRGLMGNAKLISVSNNPEAYKGRFQNRDDVFRVGQETSEKIHLMAKFLLEHEHTHRWLASGQHLINWFSDDVANDSQLDITDFFAMDDEENLEKSDVPILDASNRDLGQSFIRGQRLFAKDGSYYIAILNKTNDGRIALKYFRQLISSELLENLDKWEKKHSWERYRKGGRVQMVAPRLKDMILVAYGVDRGEVYLTLDNDTFMSDQFQKLVSCVVDGHDLPRSLVKKVEANLKLRQKYKTRWPQVEQVSLSILHQQYGRKFSPMLDRDNKERSYLFGRLLAIFELLEKARYDSKKIDNDDNKRITNAERYWTAYTNKPASLMKNLWDKVMPYAEYLQIHEPGLYHKFEKERQEIISFLDESLSHPDFSKPLDYRFIFGYYAEKKYCLTKTPKESEDK